MQLQLNFLRVDTVQVSPEIQPCNCLVVDKAYKLFQDSFCWSLHASGESRLFAGIIWLLDSQLSPFFCNKMELVNHIAT